MRVDLLSREYPPEVYGGAGVHVAELVKALREAGTDVRVRAFGDPRADAYVTSYAVPSQLKDANPAVSTLGVDLEMVRDIDGSDIVHSHTWYTNAAGHIASLLYDIPHVVTAHSLEPLRPWKAEQLGGGYRLSSWIESTALAGAARIIAVSEGMRRDILKSYPLLDPDRIDVVYNGIDLDEWGPAYDDATLTSLGIDAGRPSVVFVGRITRQKGLPYLLRAAASFPADVQLVLCAGSPDTPELFDEVRAAVEQLRSTRTGVVWIDRQLGRSDLKTILTSATVFVCPSIYEPLGIVNLEAMACGVAVVATATGGIPEVVDDGVTGLLVPIEQAHDGTGIPLHPEEFVSDLASAVNELLADPGRAREMGAAGRRRVELHFGWKQIAIRTNEIYASLI